MTLNRTLSSQGIGKIAGALGAQVAQQATVAADQVQGEDLGLEGGQFGDRRLDVDRHQNAVAFHLQGLAHGNIEIRNPVMPVEHGRDPVINLLLFHDVYL